MPNIARPSIVEVSMPYSITCRPMPRSRSSAPRVTRCSNERESRSSRVTFTVFDQEPRVSEQQREIPPVRVTQPVTRLHQLVQQDQHVERGEHLQQHLRRVGAGQHRVHRRPQIEQGSRFGLRLQRGEAQTAVVVENDLSVVRQTGGDLPVGAAPAPRHAPRSAPPIPWPGASLVPGLPGRVATLPGFRHVNRSRKRE
jgi:hypothetical protein